MRTLFALLFAGSIVLGLFTQPAHADCVKGDLDHRDCALDAADHN